MTWCALTLALNLTCSSQVDAHRAASRLDRAQDRPALPLRGRLRHALSIGRVVRRCEGNGPFDLTGSCCVGTRGPRPGRANALRPRRPRLRRARRSRRSRSAAAASSIGGGAPNASGPATAVTRIKQTMANGCGHAGRDRDAVVICDRRHDHPGDREDAHGEHTSADPSRRHSWNVPRVPRRVDGRPLP